MRPNPPGANVPLISVILPVYNGGKTIRETVDSVLAQTFADYELIVVDDGSIDSTLEVLAGIQDPRLQIFSYPNAGLAANRNRGVARARGQYVTFIDADDLWTPDKLETQFEVLEKHPQAALAYSWTDFIDEQGRPLGPCLRNSAQGNVHAHLVLYNFLCSGSNPLIRKGALDAVGGFDTSLIVASDWEMWLRLAARYEFVCVPQAQVLYRQSSDSWSTDTAAMETTCLRILEQTLAQTHPPFRHLKRDSLGNIYNYLTVKTLAGQPSRQRGWLAARFIGNAVRRDPALLYKPALAKALAITALVLVWPFPNMVRRLARLVNVRSLGKHMRQEPR